MPNRDICHVAADKQQEAGSGETTAALYRCALGQRITASTAKGNVCRGAEGLELAVNGEGPVFTGAGFLL